MAAKRKVGRPPNPDTVLLRTTTVRDTPEQMDLLAASGHSHSEAYRIGSRLLTKTKIKADLKLEEIDEQIRKADLDQMEAAERKIALLNARREIEESYATRREKANELNHRIENLVDRIHGTGKTIRSDASHKGLVLNGIVELIPDEVELSRQEIDAFMHEGRFVPSKDRVREFVRSHIIDNEQVLNSSKNS